jgi:hypothetical protein
MMADEGRVPELLLEQYALDELRGAEKARLEERLAADPGLRARLEELKRSDEEILAEYPPAEIAASIRRRMLVAGSESRGAALGGIRGAAGRRLFSARALAFPAAAAVLILAGAVMVRGLFPPPRGEVVLAKGGAPGLLVYRKSSSGPSLLADGASARAGDILQIKYSAGGARYGAIASLDGRGRVTWHLPGGGENAAGRAPRLEEGGAALGSAYELDDAPAFERFFIFSSGTDFDLSVASRALEALSGGGGPDTGALSLPAGIEYKSLLLRKEGTAR